MAEPSRRASRLAIAGIAFGLFAAAAGGFLLGRGSRPASPPSVAAQPDAPVVAPAPPATPSRLGRAELIDAASRAADAFAAGRPLPSHVAELAGRAFELRLTFGCGSAAEPGAGALSARYDAAAGVLRARAEPVSWPAAEWLARPEEAAAADEPVEVIEGFWIRRPWTSSESCPAAGAGGAAPAPAETTLGIAQIFTAGDSRLGRRDGKAFEAVERAAPESLDPGRGLQLRLRGKLARAPKGAPVLCRAPGGARPVCLLVVSFNQVAIDNPATGETIATWDVASQSGDTDKD